MYRTLLEGVWLSGVLLLLLIDIRTAGLHLRRATRCEQRAVHYLSMSIRRIRKIRVQKNEKSPFRVSFPPSEQRAVHYLSMGIRKIRVQKYQTPTIRNVRNNHLQRAPRNITHPRASRVQKSSFNISRIVAKC